MNAQNADQKEAMPTIMTGQASAFMSIVATAHRRGLINLESLAKKKIRHKAAKHKNRHHWRKGVSV